MRMIILKTNITNNDNAAPLTTVVELGYMIAKKTERVKIDLYSYEGYINRGAALGEITNLTPVLDVGAVVFDQQFEILARVNGVDVGSVLVDGIGGWSFNPLFLNVNKGETVRLFFKIYRKFGQQIYDIKKVAVNITSEPLGYQVMTPQLINMGQSGKLCDKVGVGDTFSIFLKAKKEFEKQPNMIVNSSLHDGSFTGWTSNYMGVPSFSSMISFISDVGSNISARQIFTLTPGKYFFSCNYLAKRMPPDENYLTFVISCINQTTLQEIYRVEIPKEEYVGDSIERNVSINFEIPFADTYQFRVGFITDWTNNDRIDQFGYDDIYLFKIEESENPTIDLVEVNDCGIWDELDCPVVTIGGSYDDSYDDSFEIGSDEEQECTIKEITYIEVDSENLHAIVEIVTPESGEFQYRLTDSENNTFTTPILYRPNQCQNLVKIVNFNQLNPISNEIALPNEYYFKGSVNSLQPRDAERVSHEQPSGEIIGTYHRTSQQGELTIGLYSSDIHHFVNCLIGLGSLSINDVNYQLEQGARYETTVYQNGGLVGKIDIVKEGSGFVSVN